MAAALHGAGDRGDQAGVLVGDHQPHPSQPRLRSPVRQSRQNISSSESPTSRPTSRPKISRRPPCVTPVAITTALDTTMPCPVRACRVGRVQARHRDGNPVGGNSRTSRYIISRQVRLRQIRRRPAQHLALLLEQPVALAQLAKLGGLIPGDAGRLPASRSSSVSERCRQDSEIPKSLATCATDASLRRATRTTSSRNSFGNGFGTIDILPAETLISTDQMSPTRAADPRVSLNKRDRVTGVCQHGRAPEGGMGHARQ